MGDIQLKTKLTAAEKFIVIAGTTIFGTLLSALIGKHLLLQAALTALIIYLITGKRPEIIFASVIKFPRDARACRGFFKMLHILTKWEKKKYTIGRVLKRNVSKHPNKTAFMIEDKKITFQECEDLSNKIGRYFKSRGYQKGDTVSLIMETRLEYASIWIGLSKVGIVTALININLRKEALSHSIRVASSKAIIVSADFLEALKEIISEEEISKLDIFVYDNENDDVKMINDSNINLHRELKNVSSDYLDDKGITSKDKLFYIYTSGTTGMPKAAIITHLRFFFMVSGCFQMFSLTADDIIYNTLPLYHTAGGMLGVGIVVLYGTTMALRKKFSASNFWTDCIKYNCTVAQYIGELCRFLLLTPEKPEDKMHKVKLMFGNGLRSTIWPQFANRFNIKNIGEAYGATESNTNLANIDNTIGAVGFVPPAFKFIYPVKLIKCDEETGEPIRNENGFCIPCECGEAGVFIGKITPNHASRSFAGYADKAASEKKILRDAFKKGDMYFNSSDILAMDIFGSYYFKDRTGDTYRWRGENVSTSEVEGTIMRVAGLSDCVVYGVDVPNTEGKAGMAAIVDPENKLKMEKLSVGIKDSLPAYARPIFIRILPQMPMTGTFKLQKRDLQREGFDITKIPDPIYLLQANGSYQKMSTEQFNAINDGKGKL